MSSTSAVLALLLAAAAGAQGAACPATSGGAPLSFITVFDGPPSENASLVPDGVRRSKGAEVSTWDVRGVYRAGRTVHLKCEYGAGAPIVVPVKRAAVCRSTRRGGRPSLSCG